MKNIYYDVANSCPPVPPETGGILGKKNGAVCAFVPDAGCPDQTRGVYRPNIKILNEAISQWSSEGIAFCGVYHSHPPGQKRLSCGDLAYIKTIMEAMPESVDWLYFPVVIPGDGIYPFVAEKSEDGLRIRKDETELLKEGETNGGKEN